MAIPTASDNVFPKLIESMNTSDQAAPSDSSWKIYAKANGIFARSSNSIVGPLTSPVGSTVQKVKYTGGTITLSSSTTTFTEVSSALRLTIAAAIGDILEIAFSGVVTNGSTGETAIDTATMTSPPTVVNVCGGGTRSSGHGYCAIASAALGFTGTIRYAVQAGDISGGNVTISPVYIRSAANTGSVQASSTYPINFSVVNLGH